VAGERRGRRAAILEAAAAVIVERGFCDTRVGDVAARAGASPSLVLYYFGTRDRILAEALTFIEERFYAALEAELAAIPSARDRLLRLLEQSGTGGETIAGTEVDEWVLWLDLWARALHQPEVARYRESLERRWRSTIARVIREGRDSGEFPRGDPDEVALLLSALIEGLAVQLVLNDPGIDATTMLGLVVRTAALELGFMVRGSRPRRGGRSKGPRTPARRRPG
jgi:AcrR family transcriptional regulator